MPGIAGRVPSTEGSAFEMMEVHDLYFKFELPYWNAACADPASKLVKTMAYIESKFEGEKKPNLVTERRS